MLRRLLASDDARAFVHVLGFMAGSFAVVSDLLDDGVLGWRTGALVWGLFVVMLNRSGK